MSIYNIYIILILYSLLFNINCAGTNSTKKYTYHSFQPKTSVKADSNDDFVVLNTKKVKKGTTLHFKIKALDISNNFIENEVDYSFAKSADSFSGDFKSTAKFESVTDYETNNNTKYAIKYFNIKKKKSGTDSNSLIIKFYINEGTVVITNTKEDEGAKKLKPWAIALIVIGAVALIAILTIFGVKKRRKKKKNNTTKKSTNNNNINNKFGQEVKLYNKNYNNNNNYDKYNSNNFNNNNNYNNVNYNNNFNNANYNNYNNNSNYNNYNNENNFDSIRNFQQQPYGPGPNIAPINYTPGMNNY